VKEVGRGEENLGLREKKSPISLQKVALFDLCGGQKKGGGGQGTIIRSRRPSEKKAFTGGKGTRQLQETDWGLKAGRFT